MTVDLNFLAGIFRLNMMSISRYDRLVVCQLGDHTVVTRRKWQEEENGEIWRKTTQPATGRWLT